MCLPSSLPSFHHECFADRDELKLAVDLYVNDTTCAINRCEVGQNGTLYGWPMNEWCVSKVTDMSRLFYSKLSFNEDISLWNLSHVTDMSEMFHDAIAFDGNLSSWDVSSATSMRGMFFGATSFTGNVSSWDTSSVIDMEGMLAFASRSLFGAPCLMVEAIIPIVDWINENQPEWGRIM